MHDSTFNVPNSLKADASRETGASGKRTVLLVEDEQPVRDTTRMLLEMSGYNVITAKDGVEAIEIFKRERNQVDVVLLDYQMPRMAGKEALAEMLAIAPNVRVVVSSGFDSSGPAGELLKLGAVGALQKPYRLNQLLETLTSALGGESLGEG